MNDKYKEIREAWRRRFRGVISSVHELEGDEFCSLDDIESFWIDKLEEQAKSIKNLIENNEERLVTSDNTLLGEVIPISRLRLILDKFFPTEKESEK